MRLRHRGPVRRKHFPGGFHAPRHDVTMVCSTSQRQGRCWSSWPLTHLLIPPPPAGEGENQALLGWEERESPKLSQNKPLVELHAMRQRLITFFQPRPVSYFTNRFGLLSLGRLSPAGQCHVATVHWFQRWPPLVPALPNRWRTQTCNGQWHPGLASPTNTRPQAP